MRRLWVSLLVLTGCFDPLTDIPAADDDEGGTTSSATTVGTSSMTASGATSDLPTGVPTASATGAVTTDTPTSGSSDDSSSSTTAVGETGSETSVETSVATSVGSGASSTSTTDAESSSSSTGTMLDPCGNGDLDGDEVCDEGGDNGVGAGDCAPDCSAFVQERTIVAAQTNYSSAFAFGEDSVIAVVDAGCAAEFGAGAVALFAYGEERRATLTPFAGDDQIDWVLTPWTRYLNDEGDLVWVTESIALLGIDADGDTHDLENPVWLPPENNPTFTGMNTNWTTQVDADCNGWTSVAGGTMASGNPWFVDYGDLLRLPGNSTCGNSRGLLCVLP